MAKKALLIGINRYRIPGVDLYGCVNDVEDLRAVLLELYGFPEGTIVTLTDEAATKAAIQTELETLIHGARAGDVLLAHFSGHGSNVPDESGDEADEDYRDEILCPTDLNWDDPLLDDWLRALFDSVAPEVSLTVIMDCCYSGSNTRALIPPDLQATRERYLPSPLNLLAVESDRELRGALRGVRRNKQRESAGQDVTEVDLPEVLITGCRDDEKSADAFIEDDPRTRSPRAKTLGRCRPAPAGAPLGSSWTRELG